MENPQHHHSVSVTDVCERTIENQEEKIMLGLSKRYISLDHRVKLYLHHLILLITYIISISFRNSDF